MKKIILTSPEFEGQVELLYHKEQGLMQIDLQNATLSEKQVMVIKQRAPFLYDNKTFKASFGSDTLNILELGYEITFDMFWTKYKKKINVDRCKTLWSKMSEEKRLRAYLGLNVYQSFLDKNTWRTKLDPETYLGKQAWNNVWS